MQANGEIVVGIDIGGTKAALALASSGGQILARDRLEHWSSGDWQPDLATLAERVRGLVTASGVQAEAVRRIGISAPGPLDVPAGRIVELHNVPGWVDVPIVAELESALGRPVRLENDANAAALAEWRFGAGQGASDMVFLTMSSGVGGGLILDGRLRRGATHQAGEVGHIPVELGGRLCTCGLRGCLEAYTGGHAIASIAREELASGRKSSMLERVEGDLERIDARVWVDAIREGDAYACDLRERFIDRLAQGLAALISTLDLDCVVLGTIVQNHPRLFVDDLRDRTKALTWDVYHGVRITPGALGNDLPFLSAVGVALEPQAA